MAIIETGTVLDEVLDFLVSTPTLEQIVKFRPSEELQARVRDLLDRNGSSTLTAEELEELEEFSRMNHFVSMLKIRARKTIRS